MCYVLSIYLSIYLSICLSVCLSLYCGDIIRLEYQPILPLLPSHNTIASLQKPKTCSQHHDHITNETMTISIIYSKQQTNKQTNNHSIETLMSASTRVVSVNFCFVPNSCAPLSTVVSNIRVKFNTSAFQKRFSVTMCSAKPSRAWERLLSLFFRFFNNSTSRLAASTLVFRRSFCATLANLRSRSATNSIASRSTCLK